MLYSHSGLGSLVKFDLLWYYHVSRKCQLIKLLLQRSLFRKHDFLYLVHKLLIGFYMIQKKGSKPLCKPSTLHLSQSGLSFYNKYNFCYIGGGLSDFTYQELESYLTENGTHTISSAYRFKDHILISKLNSIHMTEDTVLCKIPIHLMVTKLTKSELRKITDCHGIYCHSKMRHSGIQRMVADHMCSSCEDHITIFEKVNNAKQKKAVNMKAVKKYQAKKGQGYKMANLMAAKKYQDIRGDKFKMAHLVAAKKYQDTQGEAHNIQSICYLLKGTRARMQKGTDCPTWKLFINIKIQIDCLHFLLLFQHLSYCTRLYLVLVN